MRTSEYAQLVAQRKMLEESLRVDRPDRSAPTVRKASCIACRMASNRANVNDIQLGRDIGEAQGSTLGDNAPWTRRASDGDAR